MRWAGNTLVAFYIRSCISGFLLAVVFTAALVWLDVGRLNHLLGKVEGGYLGAFLLWFLNGIVFSGAQKPAAPGLGRMRVRVRIDP